METFDDLRKLEVSKRPFFNQFYRTKGWPYKRIEGKENKGYDVVIKIKGVWIKIEEKYRRALWNDILIETVQDLETNAPGWIETTKAKWVFYAMVDRIYAINIKKMREFLTQDKDVREKKISYKGWGKTENISIPLSVVTSMGLGKRIY